jgi:hypothetical protein
LKGTSNPSHFFVVGGHWEYVIIDRERPKRSHKVRLRFYRREKRKALLITRSFALRKAFKDLGLKYLEIETAVGMKNTCQIKQYINGSKLPAHCNILFDDDSHTRLAADLRRCI